MAAAQGARPGEAAVSVGYGARLCRAGCASQWHIGRIGAGLVARAELQQIVAMFRAIMASWCAVDEALKQAAYSHQIVLNEFVGLLIWEH